MASRLPTPWCTAIASLIYTIVSMAVEGEKQEKARNAWYDGLEKDFAAFGLKIPDKYTSTAPSNEDIDNLIPLPMGGGAA